MLRTECGATFVLAMKQARRQKGQALIEYAFLMVLLATIGFAVIALAGTQLTGLYQEVSYEFSHFMDATTLAPDGSTVAPGATPAAGSCLPGQTLELRGHRWKCK
jgi:Flp pilus assembly pilin Flp